MKKLIGKKILGLSVSDDDTILSFATDQGDVVYETWGDCCSESWFADITGVGALIGGTVAEVEEVDLGTIPEPNPRCRQEFDEAYGYKIKTDKGYADIVFRNSSNGYYYGTIGPLKGNLPDGMIPITDDWQAGEAKEQDD